MGGLDAGESALSIGYVNPGWPASSFPNGVVTYVSLMESRLREMGHKVTIVATHLVGECEDHVYPVDLQRGQTLGAFGQRVIDRLAYQFAPFSTRDRMITRPLIATICRAVREQRIQILEMEEAFGYAHNVSRSVSIPVCVRLHGPWYLNGKALGVPEDAVFCHRVVGEGRAIAGANAISAPSQDVLERTREFYKLDLPDAEVIPNPIKPVPVEKRWRLQDCDPKLVLFVGRFDHHKGGDLIIDAFAKVLSNVRDARLRFVGPDSGLVADDGQKWTIESYIRNRLPGALESGTVQWLGQQPNETIPDHRRQAMLTVTCSRYENHPYAVLESMGLGCPQVAARVGGIPEIVQHDVHALLHAPGDSEDLASKIVKLLQNPTQAARLGRQAAIDGHTLYHPDVICRRTLESYRQLIARIGRKTISGRSSTGQPREQEP